MTSLIPSHPLPARETEYLRDVRAILRRTLADQLVGVYLFGSAANGSYEPGVSDLDIQAVTHVPVPEALRRELAGLLAHAHLPCPARRLEFVLYSQGAVSPAARHPRFLLNWNTGAGERDHMSLDAAQEASHWFLLDIAMGREVGQALFGPPPAEVFSPIPRPWVLDALLDSLLWHHTHEGTSANAVLNACRAWRYAAEGVMGSKLDGAAWAMQQLDEPGLIAQALRHRRHGYAPDPAAVVQLMDRVALEVRRAIERSR
ncbi:DUF4111 domain-containing protein [Chloroflexia bacterium SDU3-3]|nr:DUF4111 domain-containing protein [Chloroflexia bacterium SDU3-3]